MPVEIVGYEVVEAGSPPSFSSWVVHQNLTENDIIEEYEKYKDKKKSCKNIWNYYAAGNRNFEKECII